MQILMTIVLVVWATAILILCGVLVHSLWHRCKRVREQEIRNRIQEIMRSVRK